MRAAILFGGWALFVPLIAWTIRDSAWFEARKRWLPACFAAFALGTMPLRMTFARPDSPLASARDAATVYGLRMAAVPAIGAGLFAAMALAGRLVDNTVASIFLGLFFFLATGLVGLVVIGSIRGRRSFLDTMKRTAKALGMAAGIVLACAVLVALRAARDAPNHELSIPSDPHALLDPFDLERVEMTEAWVPSERGGVELALSADAGDFDRTLKKLSIGASVRAAGGIARAGFDGGIVLRFPARFDSPANRAAITAELKQSNDVFAAISPKNPGDPRIRVRFEFTERGGLQP